MISVLETKMRYFLAVLIAVTQFSCATNISEIQSHYEIGQQSFTYTDKSRNRLLVTEVWYPTHDHKQKAPSDDRKVFKAIQTIRDAKIVDKGLPLLLVSHGTGGNRFSLTWLIEDMVKAGYIVVAVDHYGNSTFNKLPREFVKWWERAIDIQYVLTEILNDPKFGTKIDTSKIGGVGFSLDGYTQIALAGGYVDRERQMSLERDMPPEFPETEEAIDLINDFQIVSSYNQYKNHVKDERIKAFFVIAPAIGPGFHNKKQVEEITAPIFIIAGQGDTNTPIQSNAQVYHQLIKSSKLYLFNEFVNHYTFLNEGTEFGKSILPTITIDHPNVDRKKIHDKSIQLAIDFFAENL